ncbi:MAG: ABC transporter substrate-binding protein [Oscillospiraceae bacterium]
MKNRFTKTLSLLTAGAMTAIGLTACGADESSNATVVKDGKTLTTVDFQLKWLPSVQFMGFYVAYEKGYYEAEGIDLNIISGGSDIVSAQQVSIGAADIGVANLYGLLPYEEQGHPLVEVGQVFQNGSLVLCSKASSGIKSPADLKGKKIGAWVGTADYPIYSLLEQFDINKDTDCTIVSQDYTMDGLLSGELDVASATIYNEYIVLQESGLKPEEINVIDFDDYGSGMLEDAVIVNTDWAAQSGNAELVQGFLRASMKGWSDACKDPNAAAEIVWKSVDQSSTTLEHQKASAQQVAKLVGPDSTDASAMLKLDDTKISATADACLKYSVIKEKPAKIYDDSYIKAAVAGLS